jgi:putative Mg2+ transporter-C (MgtC) family protein
MNLETLLLRLLVATLCGAVIGLNRILHHKPAGFRTFGLVALGAAIATLSALSLSAGDPAAAARVAQGVLTGVGFVGAGVILHRVTSREVRGLTTAAAVWATAGVGIACGLGLYAIAIAGTALMLFVLVVGGPIENYFETLLERDEREKGAQREARMRRRGAGEDAPPR